MKTPREITIPDAELPRYATHPLRFMLRYAQARLIPHLIVFGSVILAVSCAVFSSSAIRHLVDTMNAADRTSPVSLHKVWISVAWLAIIIAVDNLSWRIAGWYAARTFVSVTGDIRLDLFRYLSGHSPGYFADRMPSALAARISAAGAAGNTLENLAAWSVIPPCLNVSLSLFLLVSVSPLMGTVLILSSLFLSAVMFHMARKGRVLHAAHAAEAAGVEGEIQDVVGNLPLVRTFGMLGHERSRLAGILGSEMESRGRSIRNMEKLRLVHAAMTALLTAGILVWAVRLWQAGTATVGDVVMVVNLGFLVLHGTRDLAVALVETVQHIARLGETLSALLVPHEMTDHPQATGFREPPRGDVRFEHVSFAYPDGAPVLKDFSLHIEAGTRVGLVGRSGSGKSTVLALLQRHRYVQSGAVLIDGHDIRTLRERDLRSCMSVVAQDISMLHRTIAENIRYARPDATDEQLRAAADAAGCTAFIEALPEGFDTPVGDRGVRLSGGQRQRLAIARAFLRDAPLLILDEATSALDSESEHHIQDALGRLMAGRTVIAVAHRLSTLRDFDRIVVMQNGNIAEDGSPAELERQNGLYRDLLTLQAMEIAPI